MDVQIQDFEKYCFKPDIRMGNYYFQWDADGLGLAATQETNHFKNFVRKIIPVLEQYMVFLQNDGIDRNDPYRDKKQICIRDKYNKKISFSMFIDSQGSTVFFREESHYIDIKSTVQNEYEMFSDDRRKIDSNINKSSNNKNHSKVRIDIKWLLGELLFDRAKQVNNSNNKSTINQMKD